jgi:poly-gamma-glutamate capsule biosynthesis protein CapA/YwtB (metallophosphatase superfamily)
MIFLGDIASSNLSSSISLSKVFDTYHQIFYGKRIICNFEGLVFEESGLKNSQPTLFNHSSVLNILNQGQQPILCLANNHILDLPEQFDRTMNQLNVEGLLYVGAGRSLGEAEKNITFSEGDQNIVLFNACWDFLLYNNSNPSHGVYVNKINEFRLISDVKEVRSADSKVAIAIFLHWGLDLEVLPFPMYRKFSQDLISAGANVVIGSHPHCVQGGERYEKGYIIYSLGNFFYSI